jgi:diaminopimelate decarboxylase
MAKQGFLASRIEWMKGTVEDGNRMCISHIGADCCPRQAYGAGTHERRVEVYKEDGEEFDVSENRVETSAGGPLCFQGDFIAKNVALPATLKARDILVLKDGGSNTLSLFSRHCSRLCPPVYGFRWANFEAQDDVTTIVELKPRETVEQLSNFWGPAATA